MKVNKISCKHLKVDWLKFIEASYLDLILLSVNFKIKDLNSLVYLGYKSHLGYGVVRIPKDLSCLLLNDIIFFSSVTTSRYTSLIAFVDLIRSILLFSTFGCFNNLTVNHSNLATSVLTNFFIVKFGSNKELTLKVFNYLVDVQPINDLNKQSVFISSFNYSLLAKTSINIYELFPVSPYTGKGILINSNYKQIKIAKKVKV